MRNKVLPLLALALAAAAVAVTNVDRDADVRASSRPQLLLRDGFNGSRLNRHHWNTCYWWARRGCTISSNHELERYRASQVRVREGMLRLVAERHGAGDRRHPYLSGMISSGPPYGSDKPKFAFRYGTAKVRARVPKGRGLWPAFWLLPANRNSKPEIDVTEFIGQRPETAEMHLHYRTQSGKVRTRGKKWTNARLRSGWHTFSIKWRPGSLVWLIDGVPRFRVTGNPVPDQRMYLIANLAVGGDWPGRPTAATRFPSKYKIDYVEVRR